MIRKIIIFLQCTLKLFTLSVGDQVGRWMPSFPLLWTPGRKVAWVRVDTLQGERVQLRSCCVLEQVPWVGSRGSALLWLLVPMPEGCRQSVPVSQGSLLKETKRPWKPHFNRILTICFSSYHPLGRYKALRLVPTSEPSFFYLWEGDVDSILFADLNEGIFMSPYFKSAQIKSCTKELSEDPAEETGVNTQHVSQNLSILGIFIFSKFLSHHYCSSVSPFELLVPFFH